MRARLIGDICSSPLRQREGCERDTPSNPATLLDPSAATTRSTCSDGSKRRLASFLTVTRSIMRGRPVRRPTASEERVWLTFRTVVLFAGLFRDAIEDPTLIVGHCIIKATHAGKEMEPRPS